MLVTISRYGLPQLKRTDWMHKEVLNETNRNVWRQIIWKKRLLRPRLEFQQWTPPVTCPLDGDKNVRNLESYKERHQQKRGLKIHPFSICFGCKEENRPQYIGHFLVLEGQFGGHCCFNFFWTVQHQSRKQTVVFMFANVLKKERKKKAICCTTRVISFLWR